VNAYDGVVAQERQHDDARPQGFHALTRGCPSRTVLEHLTGRWGPPVLVALMDEPQRFRQLGRRVDGISEKMLSQTLQAFERDGLVVRQASPGFPSRVDYDLTELGRSTATQLYSLICHVEQSMPAVLHAQQAYDSTRSATQ